MIGVHILVQETFLYMPGRTGCINLCRYLPTTKTIYHSSRRKKIGGRAVVNGAYLIFCHKFDEIASLVTSQGYWSWV